VVRAEWVLLTLTWPDYSIILYTPLRIVKRFIRRLFIHLQSAAYAFLKSRDKTDAMTPKNPAAVALGRRGGKATAENRTAKERSEAARKAVEARWAKEMKTPLLK
jgi:hypothetical protein